MKARCMLILAAALLFAAPVFGQGWQATPYWTTEVDTNGVPTNWQAEPAIPLAADPDTGQPTAVWQYMLPVATVEPHWFRFTATDGTTPVGPSNVILVPREWELLLIRRPGPDGNTVELVPTLRPRIVEPEEPPQPGESRKQPFRNK